MEKNSTMFNMGLAKLECLRGLLNEAHNCRMQDNSEELWDVLFSIYIEIESRIARNKDDILKAQDYVKKCQGINSTLMDNAQRGMFPPDVPKPFIDFEIFLRRKISGMGMDMPDKEESVEGI